MGDNVYGITVYYVYDLSADGDERTRKKIVRGRLACPTSRLETPISDWKEKR